MSTIVETSNVWGSVVTDGNFVTERLAVPGGWVIRVSNATDKTLSITFVADPNWEWSPTAPT